MPPLIFSISCQFVMFFYFPWLTLSSFTSALSCFLLLFCFYLRLSSFTLLFSTNISFPSWSFIPSSLIPLSLAPPFPQLHPFHRLSCFASIHLMSYGHPASSLFSQSLVFIMLTHSSLASSSLSLTLSQPTPPFLLLCLPFLLLLPLILLYL